MLDNFVAQAKKLPLPVKVFCGVFLLGMAIVAAHEDKTPAGAGRGSGSESGYAADNSSSARQSAGNRGDRESMIAQLEQQHQQLEAEARPCVQRLQQLNQMRAQAAMQGQIIPDDTACTNKVNDLASQMAVLEAQIYRLKTGDTQSSLSNITGYRAPAPSGRSYGSTSSGGSGSSGSSDQPERFDRNVIRGTSRYADNEGNTYELDTQPHYYRNPSTGAIVPSASPYPPADGSTWEELHNLDDR